MNQQERDSRDLKRMIIIAVLFAIFLYCITKKTAACDNGFRSNFNNAEQGTNK